MCESPQTLPKSATATIKFLPATVTATLTRVLVGGTRATPLWARKSLTTECPITPLRLALRSTEATIWLQEEVEQEEQTE